jgi:hypothetical protein
VNSNSSNQHREKTLSTYDRTCREKNQRRKVTIERAREREEGKKKTKALAD